MRPIRVSSLALAFQPRCEPSPPPRRTARSPSPRRPRPSSPACSAISCRSSRPRPASPSRSWRSAPGRRSTSAGAGTRTWCWCTTAPAEDAFVAEGFAAKRLDVMYNDFVVVGPKAIPAKAARPRTRVEALPAHRRGQGALRLARRPLRHARGGAALLEGGGHRRRRGTGDWYREIGQGMGPALNTASASHAYVLSDRGTWLSFRNRGDLAILVEGDAPAVQSLRRDAREPGEAPARQGGRRPGLHRLARLRRRARRRSPTTASAASSSSSRAPGRRAGPRHDAQKWAPLLRRSAAART